MFVLILQALGWSTFGVGTALASFQLRREPSKTNAEKTSRLLHLLFWCVVAPPIGIGIFYPGLTHFDSELGINPLPRQPAVIIIGIGCFLAGVYFFIFSNLALIRFGKGLNAVILTKQLVVGDIYNRTRNPMALGFYLGAVGLGTAIGSTVITLGSILFVIPIHVFYLKYFEEYELEQRMGQSYLDYKQRVPFLFPNLTSSKG
jgi:protein-S-isoprenylcysteine O-methyltransferase Ste14